MVLSCLGSAFSLTLFGFSTNFLEAIIFRSIVGLSTGGFACIRALIGDITNENTSNRVWSYFSTAWGIGRASN